MGMLNGFSHTIQIKKNTLLIMCIQKPKTNNRNCWLHIKYYYYQTYLYHYLNTYIVYRSEYININCTRIKLSFTF